MKKMSTLLLVLVLLVAFVGSAFAQDDGKAKLEFGYSGNMWLYGIMYQEAGSGAEDSQLRMRIRQFMTAKLGKMKAVVGFEYDPIFGDNVSVGTDWSEDDSSVAGDDSTPDGLELKHAYMQFSGDMISFKGGLMFPDLVGSSVAGGLMNWEDTPAIEMAITPSKDMTVKAIWVRQNDDNGTFIGTADNHDFFSLDAGFKVSGMKIRVGALATYVDPAAGDSWMGLTPQASITGKLGEMVSFGLTGGYGMTLNDAGNAAYDITAASVNLDVTIDMKPLTINPFVFVAGKNWGYFAPKYGPYPSKTQYFWYGFPIAALRGYGYEAVFDPKVDGNNLGVMNPGVKFTFAAMDNLSIYATYAFFKGMNDTIAGGDEVMGQEIDLGLKWNVMQGVTVHAGIDLFLANEDSQMITGDTKGYQAFIGTQVAW